jgi:hypothetical protein
VRRSRDAEDVGWRRCRSTSAWAGHTRRRHPITTRLEQAKGILGHDGRLDMAAAFTARACPQLFVHRGGVPGGAVLQDADGGDVGQRLGGAAVGSGQFPPGSARNRFNARWSRSRCASTPRAPTGSPDPGPAA